MENFTYYSYNPNFLNKKHIINSNKQKQIPDLSFEGEKKSRNNYINSEKFGAAAAAMLYLLTNNSGVFVNNTNPVPSSIKTEQSFSAVSNKTNVNNINTLTPIEKAEFIKDLKQIQTGALSFFIDARDSETGLVFDKIPDFKGVPENDSYNMLSIPGSGIGLMAWAMATDKGLMPKEQALSWTIQTLNAFEEIHKEHPEYEGFLPHFVFKDSRETTEIATIDTAATLSFAMIAGEYWAERGVPEVKDKVQNLYDKVNWDLVRTQGGQKPDNLFLSQGFYVKDGKKEFIPWEIVNMQDGVIATFLALGSSKIEPDTRKKMWNAISREHHYKEPAVYGENTNYTDLGLFAYELLAELIPAKDLTDSTGFNPKKAAGKQVIMQQLYAKNRGLDAIGISPAYRATYQINSEDKTAKEVKPGGYFAYKTMNSELESKCPWHKTDGTIVPPTIIGAVALNEKAAYDSWQVVKKLAPSSKYGLPHSINVKDATQAGYQVAFELGYMLKAIDDYTDGKFDKLLEKAPVNKIALQVAEFKYTNQ